MQVFELDAAAAPPARHPHRAFGDGLHRAVRLQDLHPHISRFAATVVAGGAGIAVFVQRVIGLARHIDPCRAEQIVRIRRDADHRQAVRRNAYPVGGDGDRFAQFSVLIGARGDRSRLGNRFRRIGVGVVCQPTAVQYGGQAGIPVGLAAARGQGDRPGIQGTAAGGQAAIQRIHNGRAGIGTGKGQFQRILVKPGPG